VEAIVRETIGNHRKAIGKTIIVAANLLLHRFIKVVFECSSCNAECRTCAQFSKEGDEDTA
jgi:hypothetical protein